MNPEQTLTHIEDQIAAAVKRGDTDLHICYWEKQTQVMKRDHTLIVHPVLHLLTPEEVHAGLTAKMWNRIRDKVAMCQRGAGI